MQGKSRAFQSLTPSYICVSHKTQKFVAKREFNNPMDKQAVKLVKGDETVSHLPREFCRITWYFLGRSDRS